MERLEPIKAPEIQGIEECGTAYSDRRESEQRDERIGDERNTTCN